MNPTLYIKATARSPDLWFSSLVNDFVIRFSSSIMKFGETKSNKRAHTRSWKHKVLRAGRWEGDLSSTSNRKKFSWKEWCRRDRVGYSGKKKCTCLVAQDSQTAIYHICWTPDPARNRQQQKPLVNFLYKAKRVPSKSVKLQKSVYKKGAKSGFLGLKDWYQPYQMSK